MTSPLFTPFKLGSVELPNRIVVSPMCQYSAADGSATDWHLQHLGQLAYSGAGLVMVEATAVERRGRITHGCLGLYSDENEAALARVMAVARRLGGPTAFGIQLAHAGRKASAQRPWEGNGPLAPHEDPWTTISSSSRPLDENWHTPVALGAAELDGLRETFVAAAQRAARLNFDVVEIHAAHGYLLHQFLSPVCNRREDEFGGSLDNRMRFPLAVIEAVRAGLPQRTAVGMRISTTDWIEGGWALQDSIAFVRAARERGIAYVCCSSGGIAPGAKIPVAPGFQVPHAERIRNATGVPTRAVGMITAAEQAEDIVAKGRADMVALARGFLYDPRWGWHAADRLGATTHFPPQYAYARDTRWVQSMGRCA